MWLIDSLIEWLLIDRMIDKVEVDGWVGERVNRCDARVDSRWMIGWLDGELDGLVSCWLDIWIDGWMD